MFSEKFNKVKFLNCSKIFKNSDHFVNNVLVNESSFNRGKIVDKLFSNKLI